MALDLTTDCDYYCYDDDGYYLLCLLLFFVIIGDLYLISKDNQALYSTGTGFAFIPHHKTPSSSCSAMNNNSSHLSTAATVKKPSPEDIKQALLRDDDDDDDGVNLTDARKQHTKEEQKLQLSEMIQDENDRFYHTTITPNEENPAFGKYICFISHPSQS